MVYKCKNECIKFQIVGSPSDSVNHLNSGIVLFQMDAHILGLLQDFNINFANDSWKSRKVFFFPIRVLCTSCALKYVTLAAQVKTTKTFVLTLGTHWMAQ